MIRGERTLSELAEQFDVHPHQITEWKKQLLERAVEAFDGPRQKDEPAVDVKAMPAKIGQLALENDFLEGALIKAGMQALSLSVTACLTYRKQLC